MNEDRSTAELQHRWEEKEIKKLVVNFLKWLHFMDCLFSLMGLQIIILLINRTGKQRWDEMSNICGKISNCCMFVLAYSRQLFSWWIACLKFILILIYCTMENTNIVYGIKTHKSSCYSIADNE